MNRSIEKVIEVITGGARDPSVLTFESMWREAQGFKPRRIEIESPQYFQSGTKVVIRFTRTSGSDVSATGVDEDVLVAFDKALREARTLRG